MLIFQGDTYGNGASLTLPAGTVCQLYSENYYTCLLYTSGDKAVGVAPVGCAAFAYDYFNCDMMEAAPGRAPAVATGIKRVLPDRAVFTYQGDGDLASIGTAEILSLIHI